MNIQDAVRQAVATGGYIVSKDWPGNPIRPTDTEDCCIGYNAQGRRIGKRWNPKAKDLLSEDWYVIRSIDEITCQKQP